MRYLLVWALLWQGVNAYPQLPDGSTAPDFTLTDYYGTTHNLYAYLDAGKTVFVDIFAAHCPTCWAYHQTHRLKNLYEQYGPEGSDELMVLALEHDQWNGPNEFMGIGPPWTTAGDWLTGTPYPIFDVEDPDRGVFDDYHVLSYPLIFKICPDRITERIFPAQTEAELYQKVQDCQSMLLIPEEVAAGHVWIDPLSRTLVVERYDQVRRVEVIDGQGRAVQRIGALTGPRTGLTALPAGLYLFRLHTDGGAVVKRFYLE